MKKYITLEKAVGETPLSCAESYREEHPELEGVPMAYAGRLDPMASGKLLVLLGEECKQQEKYHGLDKEYEFSVLFGIGSDTHDVLGRLSTCTHDTDLASSTDSSIALQAARPSLTISETAEPATKAETPRIDPLSSDNDSSEDVNDQPSGGVRLGLAPQSAPTGGSIVDVLSVVAEKLVGSIELPYPHFSAKTVKNKPLHMWTLEGRLDEIEIPTKESTVYELELSKTETKTRANVCDEARAKIDTIPPVTELRKALGNDFRRVDVRQDWENIKNDDSLPKEYTISHFRCVASSGTYMRSLAEVIAKKLGTCGLAWHINRTKIGVFNDKTKTWGTEF